MSRFFSGNIKGDVYGGIIAAVVALPLALAFGVSSGAGAIAGLYGAIGVGFFAALFGGTPAQISGPTGPMTVVMAAIITDYIARFPDTGLALAFTVVVMGGILQIVFGLLKWGKYVSMVPYAVISGFMTGIGVIIIILEIPPLFGRSVSGGVMPALEALPDIMAAPHYIEAALGLGMIGLIYLWPQKLKAIVPAPLFALIFGALVAALFLPQGQIHILGAIPTGFPAFHMPVFEPSLVADMLKSALVLAVLGSIDSLLTSLVADNITRTHHDPEKELVGQGIGNIVSGLFGGLPGAGATMRTVVNVKSGGHSPLSGMLHALILLSVVLGLGAYASYIPHTVLAGILITVGIGIIDWSFVKRIHRFPRRIVVIMLSVLLVTVFVDLITAVAIGIVMSSLSTIKRLADLQVKLTEEITLDKAQNCLTSEDAALLEAHQGRVVLYRLRGPLSFGAAKAMLETLCGDGGHKVLILDMSAVLMVDVTTALTIETLIERALDDQKDIRFVGLQPQILAQFERLALHDVVLEERHYEDLSAALSS